MWNIMWQYILTANSSQLDNIYIYQKLIKTLDTLQEHKSHNKHNKETMTYTFHTCPITLTQI